jgi:MFS family permease
MAAAAQRTFRLLWLGQLASNLGTQISLYAMGLWLFQRQHQLMDFAMVAVVVQMARILAMPLLGDRLARWPRRRVMVVANGLGALCTLGLAALLLAGSIDRALPLVLLLQAMAAMAEAVLVLSFSSLIPTLVQDPGALARANGLFASADGLALSLAPLLGAWLAGAAGLPGALAIDAISFLLALLSVALVRWPAGLGQAASGRGIQRSKSWCLRFQALWGSPVTRYSLVVGTAMAFVYAGCEVLFPTWVALAFEPAGLGQALLVGGLGYLLGFGLWRQAGTQGYQRFLVVALGLQGLILIGAGLVVFQRWSVVWFAGVFVFSCGLPLAQASLQTIWCSQASPENLPAVLAVRYGCEWMARLCAFVASGVLADRILRPALAWPSLPTWLLETLGEGPGRPMAVGLGAMGWLLIMALWSERRELGRGLWRSTGC